MSVVDVEVMPPLPEPGSFGVLVEVRGERILRGLAEWYPGRWFLEGARELVAVSGGQYVPREPPQRPKGSKRTIRCRHDAADFIATASSVSSGRCGAAGGIARPSRAAAC